MADALADSGSALPHAWGGGGSWQVRLRWWVPPAIAISVALGRWIGFEFEVLPILLVAAGILAYNSAFALLFRAEEETDRRGRGWGAMRRRTGAVEAAVYVACSHTGMQCGCSALVPSAQSVWGRVVPQAETVTTCTVRDKKRNKRRSFLVSVSSCVE